MIDLIVSALAFVVVLMVPYALPSIGIAFGGRSGMFNVASEGIMLVGASVGFLGTHLTGSLAIGILLAVIVGGIFGLTFAFLCSTLKLNQFVVGTLLFIAGTGLATLLYKIVIGLIIVAPSITVLQNIPIPGLSLIPIIGPIFFNQNILVYTTFLLVIALRFLLYKTTIGLKIRSVGENPRAADSLGIHVFRIHYVCVIIGSMLMSLAGAYLPLIFSGLYTDGITAGRGWIAIPLTILGRWSPVSIFLASFLFAGVETVAYRAQAAGVGLPYQLLLMLPYFVTILVAIWAYKGAKYPAAVGKPYDRESPMGFEG